MQVKITEAQRQLLMQILVEYETKYPAEEMLEIYKLIRLFGLAKE